MRSRIVFAFVGAAIASLLPGLVPDAQAAKRCSNAILDGGYGYTVIGTVNGQPFAATGRLAFDGKGKFQNIRTISNNGNISRNVPGEGTYSVGADCRGSLTFTEGGVVTLGTDLVIDDKGRELRMIATSPGTVLTIVGRKQF